MSDQTERRVAPPEGGLRLVEGRLLLRWTRPRRPALLCPGCHTRMEPFGRSLECPGCPLALHLTGAQMARVRRARRGEDIGVPLPAYLAALALRYLGVPPAGWDVERAARVRLRRRAARRG